MGGGPEQVKREVLRYFTKYCSEAVWEQPVLDRVWFQSITQAQDLDLSPAFSMEELENAVNSCDGNKARGSDGFNFNFFKKFWGILKNNMWGMIEEPSCIKDLIRTS